MPSVSVSGRGSDPSRRRRHLTVWGERRQLLQALGIRPNSKTLCMLRESLVWMLARLRPSLPVIGNGQAPFSRHRSMG